MKDKFQVMDSEFDKFKEKDHNQEGSQRSYYGAGWNACERYIYKDSPENLQEASFQYANNLINSDTSINLYNSVGTLGRVTAQAYSDGYKKCLSDYKVKKQLAGSESIDSFRIYQIQDLITKMNGWANFRHLARVAVDHCSELMEIASKDKKDVKN